MALEPSYFLDCFLLGQLRLGFLRKVSWVIYVIRYDVIMEEAIVVAV